MFFKLPHSFDVSHYFNIIIWDESGTLKESWISVFISTGERRLWVSTAHSSLALCCPLCTLKCLLFQSFVYCGSSVLKALPTCLYVGRSRWPGPPRMLLGVVLSLAAIAVSILFCGTWQYLLTGQRYPGLRALTPHPSLKKKKKNLTWHPVNQSPATDKLSFIQEVQSNVCVSFPKTNIWFQTSVLLNHVCIFSQRGVVAVLFFFSCCSSSNATPWFFYKSYKMQRCWPFEWDSQIFFTW